MDRRAFLASAAGGLTAATLPYAQAEDRGKIPVVGFLALAGVNTERQMRETLRDLGYVDGRNIVIKDRPAKGVPERLPALAEELVRIRVDLRGENGDPYDSDRCSRPRDRSGTKRAGPKPRQTGR